MNAQDAFETRSRSFDGQIRFALGVPVFEFRKVNIDGASESKTARLAFLSGGVQAELHRAVRPGIMFGGEIGMVRQVRTIDTPMGTTESTLFRWRVMPGVRLLPLRNNHGAMFFSAAFLMTGTSAG